MNNLNIDVYALLYEVIKVLIYVLVIFGWIFGVSLIIKGYINRRKRMWLEKQRYTTLLVRVPKNNEKGPLSAQMMFASLHGIYKNAREQLEEGTFQDYMSFEIVSTDKYIRFYIFTPVHLRDFIEGQVYAQYPSVLISEVEDYTLVKRPEGMNFIGTELMLSRQDFYPIKTFLNFDVDPLAGITGVLSQVAENEQIWVQVIAKPVSDGWQKKAIRYVSDVRAGRVISASVPSLKIASRILGVLFYFIKAAVAGPETTKGKEGQSAKLSGPVEQAVKAIEEKTTKLGYETKIRITFLSNRTHDEMKTKLQSIVGVFKQFNSSNLNSFVSRGFYFDDMEFLSAVQARSFYESGFILNIEELASLYHLPAVGVETPTIDWVISKKGEPPATLPIEGTLSPSQLTLFAQTDFRDKTLRFGIKPNDRRRHMYIIGQTGVGKSVMMKNMMIDDVRQGRGVAVIDPHGEFVDSVLACIPPERLKDIVVVNPADRIASVGFNLLENVDEHKRDLLASSLMSIFTKIWEGVWSARMEWILKNTILALLETPGTTLLSASRMLTNAAYRKSIIDNVKDPVVKEYWLEEFEAQAKTNPKFLTEAIAPIQNKIGQFISVPSIRNMIGQTKSTIDIKDIMDNKKILLVKIAKGDIGDDNMALLGAMLITKIQLTAMERSNMREEDMQDFYLYVDEFQNFATSSFITILAEARKYKLNLIVAHQYMAQISDEIREAVIGNAGNKIIFRVGENDASFLKNTFDPVFDEKDMVNSSNYHIYIKMMVDGVVTPPFSAVTLPPIKPLPTDVPIEEVLEASREKYSVKRELVEERILQWSQDTANLSNKVGEGARDGKRSYEAGEGTKTVEGQVVEEKPREKFRELKDKANGLWYVRKKKNQPQSNNASQFDGVKEGNAVAENIASENSYPTTSTIPTNHSNDDSDTHGHENIKDIDLGNNEVAEDTPREDFTHAIPDRRIIDRPSSFIMPEEHHLKDVEEKSESIPEVEKKDDDNEIKPGESIEI